MMFNYVELAAEVERLAAARLRCADDAPSTAAALAEQERRARRYLARTREHQQAQGAWRARVAARRPRVAARPLETA